MDKKNEVVLFNAITTEEAVKQFEDNAKEYTGLYVDLNNADERRYVKDKAQAIKDVRKKLERARIDLPADYKAKVQSEFQSIDDRLIEANKPFTLLIDDYNAERAKILAEEKAEKQAIIDAEQKEADHELALLLNDKIIAEEKHLAEVAEQERIQREAFEKQQDAMRLQQEEIDRKQAQIDKVAEEQQAKLKAIQDAEQAIIDNENALALQEWINYISEAYEINASIDHARRMKEREEYAKQQADIAAENARVAEIARQEAIKAEADAKQAKIEANKAHVGKIRKQAKEFIMSFGVNQETAKEIVLAINAKKESTLTINY